MFGPSSLPALALDMGEARIGFAVSDNTGRFVFGRGYHRRNNATADVDAVCKLAQQESVKTVIAGLPLRTDGTDSAQTIKVREFANLLTPALAAIGIALEFQDERFTTKLGQQQMMMGTKKSRREKGNLDEASAKLILETWLQKNI